MLSMSFNESLIKKYQEMDVFCLNESQNQKNLRFVSFIYLTIGGVFSLIILAFNLLVMAHFVRSAKAKRSPICILAFFLALFNILKLFEFFINLLIKTDLLGLENAKVILYGNTNQSNDYICKWLHFLPNFSGHIGVYLILLLQFHRHLALKKTTYSFNLLLHNYALTYFICMGLIFTFLIVDEFYLFDSYFTTIIYCPRTMVFICVFNDRFQLLKKFKFDTLVYHHLHTFIYNIVPVFCILFINALVLKGLRQRSIDTTIEARLSQARKMSVSGAYSASSLRRSSTAVDQSSQQQQQQQQLSTASATAVGSSTQAQAKRTRLSSSVNLSSTSQQPSPLQSIEFSVKRSKRESHLFNFNEIFLQNSDVSYASVWLSTLQVFNALPTNVLSYLAEWSSSTIDLVKHRSSSNGTTYDYETLFNKLPKQLLFTSWNLPQIHIYHVFILYGCIDMFNFSIFLIYQFYSCRLLSIDFRKFLNNYHIFRVFIKPSHGVTRNRFNSSSKVSSSRRASKL